MDNTSVLNSLAALEMQPLFSILGTPDQDKARFFRQPAGFVGWHVLAVQQKASRATLACPNAGRCFIWDGIDPGRPGARPGAQHQRSLCRCSHGRNRSLIGYARTIYYDNNVPPRAHITRALGGPVFSALGLGISLLMRALLPRSTMAREVADWSSVGHGLILVGSLAPLPIVDGGVLLKWSLVERGRTPAEADLAVKQAGLATGVAAAGAGVMLATRRRWLPALGLIAAGLVAIGTAMGKIR